MVTLDREMEDSQDAELIVRVSRNCQGYAADTHPSILRHAVLERRAKVVYERDRNSPECEDEDIHTITCPRFVSDEDRICMFPGYNKGAREHLCSDGNHIYCATAHPENYPYTPINPASED